MTTRRLRRWVRPAPIRRFDVGERSATWLELFFDLCFVAAVASLAADLHADPTWGGLLRFAALFVPIWWAWMEFTWFATAWDNDDVPFRVAMLTAMLLVIVLAASVGDVGRGGDVTFVLGYAALQLVLALLFARSLPDAGDARGLAGRYLVGDLAGGSLWLASLLVSPPTRYWVWAAAMAVLLVAPVFAVRAYAGQPYDARHIPERYGLFTIIVLGESVVAVVAGLGSVELTGKAALTGGLGFGIAACVWWLYFEFVRPTGLSRERLVAAFVWGYGHLVVYAAIAAAAIGVEFAIEGAVEAHTLDGPQRAMLGGGIAAFLLATAAIHAVGIRGFDALLATRLPAAGLVIVLTVLGGGLDPIALTGSLFLVVLGETALETARLGMTTVEAPHWEDGGRSDPSSAPG